MASSKSFVDFVIDQLKPAGLVSFRKMFGEYAIYLDGKVVALICDDHLYVKPTKVGKELIGQVTEAPPYPGAKNYFLIEEKLEDGEWLSQLMVATASELPIKAQRKKK